MTLPLLQESPASPSSDLGPYHRQDYERLPDEPRCELIYGRLYLSPSPSPRHQFLVFELGRRLADIADGNGGITLVAPLDVFLADHSVVQPDVLYLSKDRRHLLGERLEGAPDLLVEVLSPGSARRDRGEKVRLYAEHGVREYWIVDPQERQVEFLVNDGGRFVVTLPVDGTYRSPALPEVTLDLVDLWRRLDRALGD
jgi:Uma2 family endonuclease